MTCNAMRFGMSTIFLLMIQPWIPPDGDPDSDDEDDAKNSGSSSPDHGHGRVKTGSFSNGHSETYGSNSNGNSIHNDSSSSTSNQDTSQYVIEQLFGEKMGENFAGAKKTVLFWGVLLGLINFCGSGFQQWGIEYTSASKVAFISGFDIFLTPLFTLLLPTSKHHGKPTAATWCAIVVSTIGLYLVSDASIEEFEMGQGEMLTLCSTVFWAWYIIFTDMATHHIDAMHMMIVQLAVVTFFCITAGLVLEPQGWLVGHVWDALPWLLYLSVTEGVAFVLLARGQVYSPPTHATIMLSLEGVFASIGGAVFIGEHLTSHELSGCVLMLTSTFIAEGGLKGCWSAMGSLFGGCVASTSSNSTSTNNGDVESLNPPGTSASTAVVAATGLPVAATGGRCGGVCDCCSTCTACCWHRRLAGCCFSKGSVWVSSARVLMDHNDPATASLAVESGIKDG